MDSQELRGLIQATARGDRAAFTRLYEITSPRLFGLCIRLLKQRDMAEEVLQEAFIRIWHNAADYQAERGDVISWMTAIVRYKAIDRLRAIKPTESQVDQLSDNVAAEISGPFSLAVQSETAGDLQTCLEELSQPQRDSILLAFVEGLTHEELAQRLQKPLGTVKSWVRRGLENLRRCLER